MKLRDFYKLAATARAAKPRRVPKQRKFRQRLAQPLWHRDFFLLEKLTFGRGNPLVVAHSPVVAPVDGRGSEIRLLDPLRPIEDRYRSLKLKRKGHKMKSDRDQSIHSFIISSRKYSCHAFNRLFITQI